MTNQELMEKEQAPIARGASIEIAASRAAQEVQAMAILAKRFNRDEEEAFAKIMRACKRKSLAERAVYAYPRGGQMITGPSIRLAEVLAGAWGNIDTGVIELEQVSGESKIMAYAWDLESNRRESKTFAVKHQRKSGSVLHPLTDPRDIYEMVANAASRRLRSCILAVIPGDIAEAAVKECEKTLSGGGKEPLIDRSRRMVAAFAEIGVTKEMIETRLQHPIAALTEPQLVSLRAIYTSLKDGMSTREDWFQMKPTAEAPKDLDALAAQMESGQESQTVARTETFLEDGKILVKLPEETEPTQ